MSENTQKKMTKYQTYDQETVNIYNLCEKMSNNEYKGRDISKTKKTQ